MPLDSALLGRIVAAAVRSPLRFAPNGAVVRVLSGQLRGARWVIGAGTHGCWLGTYEKRTRDLVCRFVGDGQVVFDIGANVGFFSLLASRLVGPRGTVYAFEPLPVNVQALRRHSELNGSENLRIVDAAVSDRDGVGSFRQVANPSMGGLSDGGGLEVRTLALDEAIESGQLLEPDFLKIDVEGAELSVLKGAKGLLARKHPVIVLSAHGWRLFEACRELLSDSGYGCETSGDGTRDGNYLLVAVARRAIV